MEFLWFGRSLLVMSARFKFVYLVIGFGIALLFIDRNCFFDRESLSPIDKIIRIEDDSLFDWFSVRLIRCLTFLSCPIGSQIAEWLGSKLKAIPIFSSFRTQLAIANAKSLEEVEHLKNLLRAGQVPQPVNPMGTAAILSQLQNPNGNGKNESAYEWNNLFTPFLNLPLTCISSFHSGKSFKERNVKTDAVFILFFLSTRFEITEENLSTGNMTSSTMHKTVKALD